MGVGHVGAVRDGVGGGGEPCGDDERGGAGREREPRGVGGRIYDECRREGERGRDGGPERDCARGSAGAGGVLGVGADGAERMVADGVGVGH